MVRVGGTLSPHLFPEDKFFLSLDMAPGSFSQSIPRSISPRPALDTYSSFSSQNISDLHFQPIFLPWQTHILGMVMPQILNFLMMMGASNVNSILKYNTNSVCNWYWVDQFIDFYSSISERLSEPPQSQLIGCWNCAGIPNGQTSLWWRCLASSLVNLRRSYSDYWPFRAKPSIMMIASCLCAVPLSLPMSSAVTITDIHDYA